MYNSPLFNRVAGQVEVPAAQFNFRGSMPSSASTILEPMLHPGLLSQSNPKLLLSINHLSNSYFHNQMIPLSVTASLYIVILL